MKPGDLIVSSRTTVYYTLTDLQIGLSNPYAALDFESPMAFMFTSNFTHALILEIKDDWCLHVLLLGDKPKTGWTNSAKWRLAQEI